MSSNLHNSSINRISSCGNHWSWLSSLSRSCDDCCAVSGGSNDCSAVSRSCDDSCAVSRGSNDLSSICRSGNDCSCIGRSNYGSSRSSSWGIGDDYLSRGSSVSNNNFSGLLIAQLCELLGDFGTDL